MTTEDDFQAALDARPDDWQTRLVFADWLEERNDPRAIGYRALGRHQIHPVRIQMGSGAGEKEPEFQFIFGTFANDSASARERFTGCFLPIIWFKKLKKRHDYDTNPWWRYFNTRRAADDAAALTFALVGKVRRAELLAVQEPPSQLLEPPPKPKRARPKKRKSK